MEVRNQDVVPRSVLSSGRAAAAAPWASTVTVPVQQSPGACASLSAVTSLTYGIIDVCELWFIGFDC